MRNARAWALTPVTLAAAAVFAVGAAATIDLPHAANTVTERGTIYVQFEDGGWDSYDPATGALTAAFPSQVAIEEAAAASMACVPEQPTECYRPAAGILGIEQTDDAGVTWDVAWQVSEDDAAILERDYALAAGGDVELRTLAVSVAATDSGTVVMGANGVDGMVVRDADGVWTRIGFAGRAEPVELASVSPTAPSAYPWPVMWALTAFALIPLAIGEWRAFAAGRRVSRPALIAWGLAAAGLVALVIAWTSNTLSAVPALNPAYPAAVQTVPVVIAVVLLVAATLVRGGLPRGRRWGVFALAIGAGLVALGVGAVALAAGMPSAVSAAVAFAAAGAGGVFVWRESGKEPIAAAADPTPTPEWIPTPEEVATEDPYETPAAGTSIFKPVSPVSGDAAPAAASAATAKADAGAKSSAKAGTKAGAGAKAGAKAGANVAKATAAKPAKAGASASGDKKPAVTSAGKPASAKKPPSGAKATPAKKDATPKKDAGAKKPGAAKKANPTKPKKPAAD